MPDTLKYYLAVCAIAKNEDHFLEEWLAYHCAIGVEHFYIYDNMSDTPIRADARLQKYHNAGMLTVLDVEGHGQQIPSYNHCLKAYGPLCRWLAFIDLDEFIYPQGVNDFRPFLAEFEPYAGLALNWKLFGSNGHLTRPKGLVIDNYTERLVAPDTELHIKSIVNPTMALEAKNPHTFLYRPGAYCVTEQQMPVPAEEAFVLPTREKAWINHYFYRSQQDFSEKVARGRASVTPDKGGKDYNAFYRQNAYPHKQEKHIRRFSEAVRANMAQNQLKQIRPEPDPSAGAQGYIDLATAFMLAQEPEKAEVTLCRAVLRFAGHPLIWLTRAFVARKKREYQKARQFIYKALELAELPQIYLELIHLNLDCGNEEEAGDIIYYLLHTPSMRVQEEGFYTELNKMAAQLA